MRIDHVAMLVRDLNAERDFFVKYFGASANAEYHNPKTGLRTHFITFPGTDTKLELMYRPNMTDREYTEFDRGFTHLSIALGSKDEVLRLTEEIRNSGHIVYSDPRTTGDGYFESVIMDPEGNLIELTV